MKVSVVFIRLYPCIYKITSLLFQMLISFFFFLLPLGECPGTPVQWVPSRHLCLASWQPPRLQPMLLLWSVPALFRVGGVCEGSGKSHTHSWKGLSLLSPLRVRWTLGASKDNRNCRIVICLAYSQSALRTSAIQWRKQLKAFYANLQLVHRKLFLERKNNWNISKEYLLSLTLAPG